MKNVEMVELVLENGESYEFSIVNCTLELNDITESIICLEGNTFHTKTVNDTVIHINSNRNEDGLFDELMEQENILQVILHNEHEYEIYNTRWGEGDVDENSYQHSIIDVIGYLQITINENNAT